MLTRNERVKLMILCKRFALPQCLKDAEAVNASRLAALSRRHVLASSIVTIAKLACACRTCPVGPAPDPHKLDPLEEPRPPLKLDPVEPPRKLDPPKVDPPRVLGCPLPDENVDPPLIA